MKIDKKVRGREIKLELELIKHYPTYDLYQIYRIDDNNRTPLYRETFTESQLQDVLNRNSWGNEEELE